MGAAEHIKRALKSKKVTQKELAVMMGKPIQTVYNTINKDSMFFSHVEEYADAIGCDVVLVDRETGQIY